MLFRILILIVFASFASIPFCPAVAQTFTVDNVLDFGEVLDMGNGGGGGNDRIRINADGSFTHDAEFIVIVAPTPASISFTGGPPNTNYTVSVSSNIFINGSSGERWRINNYNFFPASLSTDAFGDGQFFIGARANTRRGGSTGSYPDDTFTGTLDVNVTFIP